MLRDNISFLYLSLTMNMVAITKKLLRIIRTQLISFTTREVNAG